VARRLALVCIAALAAAVALACGGAGNDEDEVKTAVREFIKATNERDAGKWCGELVTEQFREQVTGATGDRAKDSCRQLLEAQRGSSVELVSTGRVKVDGEEATARVTLERQGQRMPRLFRLEKEEGDWRLASDAGQ
jgi:hypothetical protein